MPERPGNKRVDSLKKIISNPHVGLLFLVPPLDETVRINGRATITTDPGLLASLSVQGTVPGLAIVVDPDTVPTLAAIMAVPKRLPLPDETAAKQGRPGERYPASVASGTWSPYQWMAVRPRMASMSSSTRCISESVSRSVSSVVR